jgi:hypothetical protein
MSTSTDHLERPPQVLSYASPRMSGRERRSPIPWFALASGVLAWVPVFLSFAGARQTLWVAPVLGAIGLVMATICVINSDSRSREHHAAGALALLSTLAGILVAINALID